ncbi:MAG: RtcB family protein [Hyphomonadaceae bacterium]|nr:RtcB family protein [Hyphomonadaceae bacterium]
MTYEVIRAHGREVKAWISGVPVEHAAIEQLRNTAMLDIVWPYVAAMPDVHFGRGATVGSVIPTKGAIIPAAVGVDIGCGMMAQETSLTAKDLPDTLAPLRSELERKIPVGNGPGGEWKSERRPGRADQRLKASNAQGTLADRLDRILDKHPKVRGDKMSNQMGTLGGGNHFVEICLDERDVVWVMLHSGSRGTGNMLGNYFIERARESVLKKGISLPDRDLAYFVEGEDGDFADYVEAVMWAQDYARANRETMMASALEAMREALPPFKLGKTAVNCHHNYVEPEDHFGERVWVTRKGAVRAREGDLGIIPGSMGAKSFIVRGLGNADALCSCSHGAGRTMSRAEAKRRFTVEDHLAATAGVECRKDEGVIDETPMAYKDIDAVMAAQADLVSIVHTLKQVVCVKG